MKNELDVVGPRKTERWLELEDTDDKYQELEKWVDGDPRGIDWNKLMLQMPSFIWYRAQNAIKEYLKEQRELVHRQLDQEMKKPRRMPYSERQKHYIQFNG